MVKRLTSITPFIVKKNSILASRSNAALGDTVLYNIALFFSLLNLLVSVIMWYFFNNNYAEHIELGTQFQFIFEINHFSFGVDGISIFFVLLTTFITPIAIFSSYELYVSTKGTKDGEASDTTKLKIFLISLLLLESLQICAFVSLDLLLFYIFFESAKWTGISLLCLQLPNSGKVLKLLVPSHNLKVMSGWTNHSGTVTSQKICENKMGNRGSKSIVSLSKIKNTFVKEQRVDGSYFEPLLYSKLRCTLMGCESNYQISNPSKQFIIQTRSFYTHSKKLVHQTLPAFIEGKVETQKFSLYQHEGSSVTVIKPKLKLDPWEVTGFTDGEGCFGLYIYENIASKIGWYVFLDFKITLHERDKDILYQIQKFFGVGGVFNHGEQTKQYGIKSIKDQQMIIAHFDKFPLMTQKVNDYILFKKAFDIIINKEHLTKEGLDKLIAIKCSMNKGLPPKLVIAFPHIKLNSLITVTESVMAGTGTIYTNPSTKQILDPNWLSGFASGEGSFQVDIKKNKTFKQGHQVLLRFSIGQQARDEELLRSFMNYWNCGKVQKKTNKKYNKEYFEFRVEKFADIDTKIIPFFIKYPIIGQKQLDFQDFCQIAKLMREKAHITIEGFNEILKIKERMNTGRIY